MLITSTIKPQTNSAQYKNNSTSQKTAIFCQKPPSFGLKFPEHVRQRVDERGISLKSIIDTIRHGKKFFVIEKGKERIVNLAHNAEGKVPEGTLLVVTDKTGDMVITACKTQWDECEIAGNKLTKKSHHNINNQQTLDSWKGKFDNRIFDTIEIIAEKPHPNPHIDWRKRNPRQYY